MMADDASPQGGAVMESVTRGRSFEQTQRVVLHDEMPLLHYPMMTDEAEAVHEPYQTPCVETDTSRLEESVGAPKRSEALY